MENKHLHVLLVDDDCDDCDFFQEAIDEISETITLSLLNDGVEITNYLLANQGNLPDLIFMDLNMPKKSGMECVDELKLTEEFQQIPIIIYSTSLNQNVVNDLFEKGAHHYIQKPGEFSILKSVIEKAIKMYDDNKLQTRCRESFIIQV